MGCYDKTALERSMQSTFQKNILQPFRMAQQFLEAQNYVTGSCIPLVIKSIRLGLMNEVGNDAIVQANFVLRDVLLDDLNTRFGSGDDGTVFGEHLRRGPNNRPIGFIVLILLAVALDPRTKNGVGVGHQDIEDIYKELKVWTLRAVSS